MVRFSSALITVLMFVVLPLAAQDTAQTAKPKPLDGLNTVSEIREAFQTYQQDFGKEIQALAASGKEQMTPEKMAPYLEKIGNYAVACGEKMLKIAKEDAEKATSYQILWQGLRQQDQAEKIKQLAKLMKDEGFSKEDWNNPETMTKLLPKLLVSKTAAAKKLEALYDEIEKSGKFIELLAQYKLQRFMEKAMTLQMGLTLEKFEQFKAEALSEINKAGEMASQYIQFLLQVTELSEAKAIDPNLHDKTVQSVTEFLQSDKCTLPKGQKDELVNDLVSGKRRGEGADLNLYGKTIDGKDFDWKKVLEKNKAVLVKFTATWCGPCRSEIPGMLEAYKKYHDKGFEIVSVYCFENEKPVETVKKMVKEEKLPWIIVSEFLTEKAGGKPQGKYYGIEGVPTMLLVDKSGKVTVTEARSDVLQKKLAEVFK
jgi:thiol-disulfide isomerase/thioredoxin